MITKKSEASEMALSALQEQVDEYGTAPRNPDAWALLVSIELGKLAYFGEMGNLARYKKTLAGLAAMAFQALISTHESGADAYEQANLTPSYSSQLEYVTLNKYLGFATQNMVAGDSSEERRHLLMVLSHINARLANIH